MAWSDWIIGYFVHSDFRHLEEVEKTFVYRKLNGRLISVQIPLIGGISISVSQSRKRHHPQYLQARGLRDRARRGSTDAAAIVKEAGPDSGPVFFCSLIDNS